MPVNRPLSATPHPALALEMLALAPSALLQVGSDGRLSWANDAALLLLGPRAAARPPPLLATLFRPPPGHAGLPASAAAWLASTAPELALADPEAASAWVRVRARALADGSALLELQPADAELALRNRSADSAHQAELLDLAREFGHLGTWERNLRTGERHWDEQMRRMWGLRPDQPTPDLEGSTAAIIDDDRPAALAYILESQQREGHYTQRYRIRSADGRIRRMHSHWQVRNGSDGRPERVLGVLIDESDTFSLAASAANGYELESQLALAVDLGRIAFWRHDLATQRVHYNNQAYAVLDIPPRPEGLSIDEVRSFIHPDDLPQVTASAQRALASSEPTDMDARYRRRDGSWRHVMTRRVLQRDAQGRPLAFVGVALDVTDRVEAERQSSELSRRFELVTRTAGIGYWSMGSRDERANWSQQLRDIFGLAPGEPVPTLREWLEQLVHPDDRARIKAAFADWVRTGREREDAEFRVLRRDGQVRQVLAQSRVESPGRNPLLFGVVIDVTESRSAAQALRTATERVALAARGAGLATWELDQTSGRAYWDEQMWRLRGVEPQPEVPDLAGRLAFAHPDDRELVAGINRRGLEENGQIETVFRVVWPDGQVRWLASRSALVHDAASGSSRRIGVNWDVTDRHTGEVERQQRELAQRESQAKSQFLARMSHELRTPLNAVLGFTQLLSSDERGRDDASLLRQRRLDHIHAAGQHLLSLINDVLDLASLESGDVRIDLAPVALASLVAEVLPLLAPLQAGRQIQIRTEGLDQRVQADPTRLRQVLLNLLSNAVKYNRDGGQVLLGASLQDGQLLLRVQDTGRGMNALQMRHLFEPFNRLGLEHEGIEGTGIGLAIVKSLVERMGGSVRAESEPGVGSCFEVRLAAAAPAPPPVVVAAPPAAPAPDALAAGNSPSRRRGTILYVEDNPVNALIITELVARRPDLSLHVAVDGLSGVAQARALRPDLVLLDMQLPDMDGFEVLRRLRADPATSAIAVIALSANAMPEDIGRALRAGMADYWTKPLDFRAFMAALDSLFGRQPA
jgi:PAS domain S-box-containing protein